MKFSLSTILFNINKFNDVLYKNGIKPLGKYFVQLGQELATKQMIRRVLEKIYQNDKLVEYFNSPDKRILRKMLDQVGIASLLADLIFSVYIENENEARRNAMSSPSQRNIGRINRRLLPEPSISIASIEALERGASDIQHVEISSIVNDKEASAEIEFLSREFGIEETLDIKQQVIQQKKTQTRFNFMKFDKLKKYIASISAKDKAIIVLFALSILFKNKKVSGAVSALFARKFVMDPKIIETALFLLK